MRIGEICVRVLNKNLLHILRCLRSCLWPCLRLRLVALFGQMEKNRRARHKASTAGWLPPSSIRRLRLVTGAGAVGAEVGSKAGAQAVPLCVVACIYSYRLQKVCMEK